MSTRGQFNTKNPTIKRILKEASELAANASPDLHAEPLEDNLFEWHFTLRGPPSPSPYEGGIYHGRIILPPTYPLRPPSFRFLTATGRFEVNREICLSISGHHEETWQPAWGIRTAMVAIRSFMDTDAKGQLGGIECSTGARKKMAVDSGAFTCPSCGKSNADIIKEREEAAMLIEAKEGKQKEETVPEELRLAYREELGSSADARPGGTVSSTESLSSNSVPATDVRTASVPVLRPTRTVPLVVQQPVQLTSDRGLAWIDACIYGIVAALLFMVFHKLF
ncbi:UBC-like protein [Pleomassaria siparia CBS 279.74]|uniref:UBC-like protein n=1 Tax=Pleomassaria siparia CBS 279.74 TaxID=1314801 RepID=A0A6G1KBJ1_9PLEO|nr:UBC-like protein [Pleomassaria siparia CBS 279.74]